MQKRATRLWWPQIAGAFASVALSLLFAVAGLPVSAGMIASSGPVVGDEPTTGLWGAEDGEILFAARGPVEQQKVQR
jgi:hypothetical protein